MTATCHLCAKSRPLLATRTAFGIELLCAPCRVPLVKGGQGNSADDVRSSARGWLLVAAVAAVVFVVVRAAEFVVAWVLA